jgi:ABC-2 type transport system ATP-binding protein
MDLLTAEHICKNFTNHCALDDVSISVPEGKIYGLLGPNGAGKTTLIRIINHITAPDSGTVYFNGKPMVAADVAHIGYLPEERGLYKKMKVGDQAMFFARLKGMSKRDAENALRMWFERLDISQWWDKKVEELSKGMAQKVQFIVTVLHRPSLLIFDEPFSGFDPINANILKNEILKLRDEGATIIFSTHNMASVEEVCDRISLINRSRNILTGDVLDLRRQFSGNTYELSYVGNPMELQAALQPIVRKMTVKGVDKEGASCLSVSLHSEDDARLLIAKANEAVQLRSFRQFLPTMDDIFIMTVENYNAEQNTEAQ